MIGGLDLQRIALKHALEGGEVPVEIITLGRMTQATLAWWFEDARALHFSSSDAIARIAQATVADTEVDNGPGAHVASNEPKQIRQDRCQAVFHARAVAAFS